MSSPVLEIVPAQYAPSVLTTLYTSPAGVTTRVDKITITNTDVVAQSISIHIVPSGGTADSSNITTDTKTLTSKQTFNSPNEYGHYLNPGDALAVVATAASVVNILVGGTQVTG